MKKINKIRPVVISLTCIPSRYSHLPKKTYSLINQSIEADAIEVYIPKRYRRFPKFNEVIPRLDDRVKVIYVEEDLGPASKLLFALDKWGSHDVDILVCDDDRLQDKHWVSRFVQSRHDQQDSIICERGWNIKERFGLEQNDLSKPRAVLDPKRGRTMGYRLKRFASLGLYHPPRDVYQSPGYVDIFEGFLGALIRTGSMPKMAWDIPDILWTVDDVWLSGMAKLNAVNVWAHALPRPVYSNGHWDKVDALTNWVEGGVNRDAADRKCVEYLRNKHNVWR